MIERATRAMTTVERPRNVPISSTSLSRARSSRHRCSSPFSQPGGNPSASEFGRLACLLVRARPAPGLAVLLAQGSLVLLDRLVTCLIAVDHVQRPELIDRSARPLPHEE